MLAGIEGVSLDLWRPYQSLVEEMMPKATVVADRFHVTKLLNEELDNERKDKRAQGVMIHTPQLNGYTP